MTRLGDLLHFGQPFKACGNKYLPKSPTLLGNFCKGVTIIHFSSEIIFGQLLLTFGDFYLVTLEVEKIEKLFPWQFWRGKNTTFFGSTFFRLSFFLVVCSFPYFDVALKVQLIIR